MCPTNPQKDLKTRKGNEPFSGRTASGTIYLKIYLINCRFFDILKQPQRWRIRSYGVEDINQSLLSKKEWAFCYWTPRRKSLNEGGVCCILYNKRCKNNNKRRFKTCPCC